MTHSHPLAILPLRLSNSQHPKASIQAFPHSDPQIYNYIFRPVFNPKWFLLTSSWKKRDSLCQSWVLNVSTGSAGNAVFLKCFLPLTAGTLLYTDCPCTGTGPGCWCGHCRLKSWLSPKRFKLCVRNWHDWNNLWLLLHPHRNLVNTEETDTLKSPAFWRTESEIKVLWAPFLRSTAIARKWNWKAC